MKATTILLSALAAALCFGATSCGKPQSGAAAAPRNADGPAGVWEMRYQDAVGQSYFNVLELRPDGSYATYMQDATPDDHGGYALADGALTFTSKVDPRFSQSLPYELQDDRLKIFTASFPGAGVNPPAAEWRRSDALPAFQTKVIAGDELPVGLPGMATAAMASHALPWRADAQPVSLEVEISPPGRGVNVRLRFFSPAANEGLQLNITKYTISSRPLDGARMERRPLPADFTDLAVILDKAASEGVAGAFRRADLKMFEKAGPAWMISPEAPRGATYSAITGERIHGDVTGYIAQYEADWAKNAAIWRQVIAQQKNDGDDLKKAFDNAQDEYDQGICELDHGSWRDGACYER
ncbi:MAG: hypothetical protein KDE05_15900 [Parvularculaceae bacterium]|nr:hypothetical protein [Parvularculaceae bacterium]